MQHQKTKKQKKSVAAKWKQLSPAKKFLLALALIFILLIVWIAGAVIYEMAVNGEYYAYRYSGEEQRFEPLDITFAPADFEENIYENAGYLAKNRDIEYISGAQSSTVALDEDGSYYGAGLVFFQQYFRCLVNGDYTSYPDFFWDSYTEDPHNLPIPTEPFTKQKLYGFSVDYRAADTVVVSPNESTQYYVVRYAIYQNNGTFRPDIRSDTVIPLLFALTTRGEETRISNIIKYTG